MGELLSTIGYWLLNIAVIIGAIFLAIEAWNEKQQALNGTLFILFGVAWHIYRGIDNYQNGTCSQGQEGNNALVLANACVPHLDGDIVTAQIAILAGVFVLVAIVMRAVSNKKS